MLKKFIVSSVAAAALLSGIIAVTTTAEAAQFVFRGTSGLLPLTLAAAPDDGGTGGGETPNAPTTPFLRVSLGDFGVVFECELDPTFNLDAHGPILTAAGVVTNIYGSPESPARIVLILDSLPSSKWSFYLTGSVRSVTPGIGCKGNGAIIETPTAGTEPGAPATVSSWQIIER